MAKVLIVPDVHGRSFWHKAKDLIHEVDHIVFLGDYLDPYKEEGITFDTALEEFNQILQFKEKYSDKVTLLLGNHDMHYVILDFMDCSRMNYLKRQDLHQLYQTHLNKFKLMHTIDNKCMFSHAGVYQEWLDSFQITLDELNDLERFLTDNWKSLEALSFYRGGYSWVGSCVWADLRESLKHDLLPGFKHIVGHTQLMDKPYTTTSIACVDVRRCFILNTETLDITDA